MKIMHVPLTWRQDLNTLLDGYGVPLFIFIMLIGAALAVASNFDKLRAQDWKTKQEGMFSVLWVLLYVFLGVAALGFILTRLTSWSPSI